MNFWQQWLTEQAITTVIGLLRQITQSQGGKSQYFKVFVKVFASIWQVYGDNPEFVAAVQLKGVPVGDVPPEVEAGDTSEPPKAMGASVIVNPHMI